MKLCYNGPKESAKIWQYSFENLGGMHLLCYSLTSECVALSKSRSNPPKLQSTEDDEIDEGVEFIRNSIKALHGVDLLVWYTKADKIYSDLLNVVGTSILGVLFLCNVSIERESAI